MIQLFLTLLLLIILMIIINTKESFYFQTCNNFRILAMNDYDVAADDEDGGNNKKRCFKLFSEPPGNIKPTDTGYIIIKNKNSDISEIIELKSNHIIEQDDVTKFIKLTKVDIPDINDNNTYLITLNIKNDDDKLKVYNTIEITARDVDLSRDDLNTKCPSTTDRLITLLKNKNIVFSL